MREAQLDKVCNGGFKCHSAGPDISLFDMESKWEWSSQGELISTPGITNSTLSQSSEGKAGLVTLETFKTNNPSLAFLDISNDGIYLHCLSFVISPLRFRFTRSMHCVQKVIGFSRKYSGITNF